MHRTPIVWNKKPLFHKQTDESQSGCSYMLTDENVNSENHQSNNIESVTKPKKTKKVKNKFSISGSKDNRISSFLNENSSNEHRRRELSVKTSFNPLKIKQQIQELTFKVERNYSKNKQLPNYSNNNIISKFPSHSNKKTSSSIMKKRNTLYPTGTSTINSHDDSQNISSDFFEYGTGKECELTAEEKLIYGDREPKHYKKVKLLGKGGCGVVWLVIDQEGKEYAAKQISKKPKPGEFYSMNGNGSNNQSHASQMAKKEIEIMKYLQEANSKEDNDMIAYHDSYEDNNDVWIICAKGGYSLSDLSLKIKGEFVGTERIYCIRKGHFLHKLTSDLSQFKMFIRKMISFIHILNKSKIIHSDIKPDNILINYDRKSYELKDIKIIDFGSAYFLDNPANFASNTPEYISPEIIKFQENSKSCKDTVSFLHKMDEFPWCIDMWSLGVTLLELVLACPLWMSYKAKVVIRDKVIYKTGLFGVKGRESGKIYSKQVEMVKNLKKLLNESLIDDVEQRALFCDLLSKMLCIDYTKRISPIEALQHHFLKEEGKVNEEFSESD